ncbi:MAG: Na+/H+ antiporter NhaC family protein [Peptostreptococcaceae bacterium]|nr:Na+/H+ antiporter NhaC family protein [Peptostreptococcaceae bacterium]
MGSYQDMNWGKALLKLTPILLLAGLMISGQDALIAAPAATIYAMLIGYITEKFKLDEMVKASVDNIQNMQLVFFILMFAYAMADAFMTTGVGASIVNLALSLGLNAKFVAPVGLLVTAILSIATGTSWGTFAACAPIFLWLNHLVGGSLLLTTAAIAGGACFGDNIGLISDTTVVSSGIQGVSVVDRIRYQGVWSGLCLLTAFVITIIVGLGMGLPSEVSSAAAAIDQITPDVIEALREQRPAAVDLLDQVKSGVPIYMIIPLILVIGLAVKGVQTLLCLGAGIISSFVLGSFAGTVESVQSFVDLIYGGFEGAGSWVIIMMMWVGAFGGIMAKMKAFEPLSRFVTLISRRVRDLMTCNALLCLFGNAALSDEMAQIVTVGPIIKELVDENIVCDEKAKYALHLRNATFSDAMGVFGSQLIPWHVYIGFYIGIASAVYPIHKFVALDIIRYNFMAMVAVGSMLVLTFTGLDNLIPRFKMPNEPEIYLKKNAHRFER